MSEKPHTTVSDAHDEPPVRLRVALLGLNAWVVALLVPSLHIGLGSLDAIVTSVPLVVLAIGVAMLGGNRDRARWALLAGYPASIGAVLAFRTELTERDAYGLFGLALAALSLLAFTAAAAHACSLVRPSGALTQTPLERDPVAEPFSRRWARRALLAITAAGALAVTLIAPTATSRREQVERWGEAADDATVLTSVVAATVACIAIGIVVGPALRATRASSDTPVRRQRRLAAAMLVAAAAGVGWLVLRHFDRAAGV